MENVERSGWGGDRTNPSSSSLALSRGAKLLAPSKHKFLAFGWGQDTVSLVLQTSHTGHLHGDWVHTVWVTEPGARGIEVGRCQESPKNQRQASMGTG